MNRVLFNNFLFIIQIVLYFISSGAGDFSVVPKVHTDSGAHQVSCLRFRTSGITPLLPYMLAWRGECELDYYFFRRVRKITKSDCFGFVM
jgi:hypothetical protein